MQLYGKKWSRREIEARIGRIEQVGGIRKMKFVEGPEAGVEMFQVRTGAGLTYYVSPTRGLDISLAEYSSVPISWQSPNGDVHPSYYDSRGLEWLRTAVGGLLMTCGLTQVGSPNTDQGKELGLHGRVHNISAGNISAGGYWIGDDYEIRISGIIEETMIFNECLRLTREIKSRIGENSIIIKDKVENIGFATSPHMMLYHFNFGFPLMAEKTKVIFPSNNVRPRENTTPLEGYDSWHIPAPEYQERVYYHENFKEFSETDLKKKSARVLISNPEFPHFSNGAIELKPLSIELSWATESLQKLVQWKMPGQGVHVMGIEPANCWVEGRNVERQRGSLQFLQPGELVEYDLQLKVISE